MSPEMIAWLVFGLLIVVVVHELSHILIARAHGHRTVCVAINPVGVAVVFEDTPSRRYWAWQVLLPMLVTAVTTYAWLYGLALLPADPRTSQAVLSLVHNLPAFAILLAVLTSGGDIAGLLVEARRPVWGEERILRDLRVLRRIPSVVRFTAYGRTRWEPRWRSLGRPSVASPAASPVD